MNERRSYSLEIRESGDGRILDLRLVPYDEISDATPVGPEMFERGAFRRSIAHLRKSKRWPKLLRAHDQTAPIGSARSLSDEDEGPRGEFRIADTALGNEARQEVREMVLDGVSIGFTAVKERLIEGVRHVQEARLNEVSLVSVPAYEGARVLSVRSAEQPLLPPRPDVPEPRTIMIAGVRWTV